MYLCKYRRAQNSIFARLFQFHSCWLLLVHALLATSCNNTTTVWKRYETCKPELGLLGEQKKALQQKTSAWLNTIKRIYGLSRASLCRSIYLRVLYKIHFIQIHVYT